MNTRNKYTAKQYQNDLGSSMLNAKLRQYCDVICLDMLNLIIVISYLVRHWTVPYSTKIKPIKAKHDLRQSSDKKLIDLIQCFTKTFDHVLCYFLFLSEYFILCKLFCKSPFTRSTVHVVYTWRESACRRLTNLIVVYSLCHRI